VPYPPEDLLALKVVVAGNLQPATIRGVVSQGILLGAACSTAVNRVAPNGTPVQ
jgi:tRNA-binding EMAP/Myf-like protein